jgi:hypothetical protein
MPAAEFQKQLAAPGAAEYKESGAEEAAKTGKRRQFDAESLTSGMAAAQIQGDMQTDQGLHLLNEAGEYTSLLSQAKGRGGRAGGGRCGSGGRVAAAGSGAAAGSDAGDGGGRAGRLQFVEQVVGEVRVVDSEELRRFVRSSTWAACRRPRRLF